MRQFVLETARPEAPRSCTECRAAQSGRADPDECWFGSSGCPFERLSADPALVRIYEFAMRSIETWDSKGAGNTTQRHAGISPDRFSLALRLYRVPDVEGESDPRVAFRDAFDAYEWVTVVARAISDAPNEATRLVRSRREAESLRELETIKGMMAAFPANEKAKAEER